MRFTNFTFLLLIIISGSINAQVNSLVENITLMNQKGEIISTEENSHANKDGETVIYEVLNPSEGLVDEYLKTPIKGANYYEAGPLPEAEYLSDMIYSTDGSKVFFLGRQSESVTVFDVSTKEVITNVTVGAGPLSIDINDNVAVVACHFDNALTIIDLSDYSTVDVNTSDSPTYVKINPAGTHAYVGVLNDVTSGTCEIINLSTYTVETTITDFPVRSVTLSFTTGHGRNYIKYNPLVFTQNGDYLVVCDKNNNALNFYNTTSNTFETQIAIPGCMNLGISPDSLTVYTTSADLNKVYRIDVTTQSIIGNGIEIPNGINQPTDIVSNSDGTKIYLGGNSNNGNLVDFIDNEVTLINSGKANWCGVTYDRQYAIAGSYNFTIVNFNTEALEDFVAGYGTGVGAVSPNSYEAIGFAPVGFEGAHIFSFPTVSNINYEGTIVPADGIEGDAPVKVKVTADGSKVLTANICSQNVTVFNLATNSIDTIFSFPFDADIKNVSATHDSQYAIVTFDDLGVSKIIDLNNLEIVATVPGGGHTIRISADNQYAYVSNVAGTDKINIIHLDGAGSSNIGSIVTGQMGSTYAQYGILSDIRISPDGNYLAIAVSFDDAVKIVDLATNTIVQTLTTDFDFPLRLCFSDDGTRLAASNYYGNTVTIINFNGSSSSVQGVYSSGGTYPTRMAFNSSTNEFYVCNNNSNNVAKIDANTGSLTGNIGLPGSPTKVAFDSKGNHIILYRANDELHKIINSLGEEFDIPSRPANFDINPNDITAVVSPGLDYLSIINWTTNSFELDLRVYLEGPFVGVEMTTSLNSGGLIPLSQPFNTAPWNYQGTEAVGAIPNTEIVDWVLVELRDAATATQATGQTMVARSAGFLLKDGNIVDLDGQSLLSYSNLTIQESLFVVIWHRNHFSIMSAIPLVENGGVYTYDFTSGAGQVYGGSIGHREISPGIWGMVGGDGNSDNQVNNSDKIEVWLPEAGTNGYLQGDFDMNTQVNNQDKLDVWSPNSGSGGQVPETTNEKNADPE
ncbi:MAG: beta-propeller fold lactonase family protein [Bacteroidales bacterium]|nr:beta-propeller fold lactonase family protein [Bacteroidales bacterium]